MRLHTFAAACTLLLAPTAAFAHGTPPAPAHGGQVVEDSAEHWVELVTSGALLTVYVLDEGKTPIPSAQLGGKATVLVGGKSQVVALAPGDGNSLTGKLAQDVVAAQEKEIAEMKGWQAQQPGPR